MADVTRAAALLALTEFKPEEREIGRLLVSGALLDLWALLRPAPRQSEPELDFEDWLVEHWLKDIRSEAFAASVQRQRLIAEWERGE
mgnify:CR=1 FL=1